MRYLPVAAAILAAPFVGLGLMSGCSSSSGSQGSNQDAQADMAAPDVTADAVVDAGPDIDQQPDVYPSQHEPIPQIHYFGGPILDHPRIVTITFTGNAHRDALRSFDHNITASDWWMQTAEGYCVPDSGLCVGAGNSAAPDGGAWLPDGSTEDAGDGYLDVELPYDLGASVDDSQIGPWLDRHVTAGDFPPPDSETVYAIYFPATTSITSGGGSSCSSFGAYHTSATVAGQSTSYAVMPYCDYGQGDLFNFTQVEVAASHEIAESTTDPLPNDRPAFLAPSNDAWELQQSLAGGECGDMCEGLPSADWPDMGYTYQRIWSNQAAALSEQPCQPWPNVYFAAAVRTTPISVNGHTSYGYVTVKRGQDTTAIADVFSQAPLPHDLQLVAGKAKGSATTTPQDVGPPDEGITITLSKNQGLHNGSGIFVTFTVPASAQVGDVRGVVLRAILDTDYNDWPIILRVQ
jgi:hypothetical protein